MNFILFDGKFRDHLLPFTHTRPVAALRLGILTLREKWEYLLGASCSFATHVSLNRLYPLKLAQDNVFIHASLLPNESLAKAVQKLSPGEGLFGSSEKGIAASDVQTVKAPGGQHAEFQQANELLALRLDEEAAREFISAIYQPATWEAGTEASSAALPFSFSGRMPLTHAGEVIRWKACEEPISLLRYPEELFQWNAAAIEADFRQLTKGRSSAMPAESNRILGDQLFIEADVDMELAVINTTTGPVYIGKGAVIMEGALLRGPLAIGEGAVVKMGARIYGPTTIGPRCVVGGEIKQSLLLGNSNKSHDGYLGNSVIGEWCNLGADTNCSNMKNNYKPVKLYNYASGHMRDTGLSYCGLMMGDYSRSGIGTLFNTGTVVGVNVNIFGDKMPPAFIPDFTWAGNGRMENYRLEKALEAVARMKKLKGAELDDEEKQLLSAIFEMRNSN